MRKLQLIKPWRLRTVRLRLTDEEHTGRIPGSMPCNGPQGTIEEACHGRTGDGDMRNLVKNTFENVQVTAKAPRSTAIFGVNFRLIK